MTGIPGGISASTWRNGVSPSIIIIGAIELAS
jgi:hypothetical protein